MAHVKSKYFPRKSYRYILRPTKEINRYIVFFKSVKNFDRLQNNIPNHNFGKFGRWVKDRNNLIEASINVWVQQNPIVKEVAVYTSPEKIKAEYRLKLKEAIIAAIYESKIKHSQDLPIHPEIQ